MNQELSSFSIDSENRPDLSAVEQMETLARKYHAGQFRKDGKTPYFEHPAAVVARLRRWGAGESGSEKRCRFSGCGLGARFAGGYEDNGRRNSRDGFVGRKDSCRNTNADICRSFGCRNESATRSEEGGIHSCRRPDGDSGDSGRQDCRPTLQYRGFLFGLGERPRAFVSCEGADLLENAHRLDSSIRAACENDIHALLVRLLDKNNDNASLIALLKTSIGR